MAHALSEEELISKIQKIERLYEQAQSPGEQEAALAALGRIESRLDIEKMRADKPEERVFSISDPWQQKVFIALLRKHNIKPFRYPRQKRQTIVARIQPSLLDFIIWPEFEQIATMLNTHLASVANRVIKECIHQDTSDVQAPPALGHG